MPDAAAAAGPHIRPARHTRRAPFASSSSQSSCEEEEEEAEQEDTPPPPKRIPTSPYQHFCSTIRGDVKQQLQQERKTYTPQQLNAAVQTELGARWRALTPAQKKPFEDKYNAEKAALDAEYPTAKNEHQKKRKR
jgi:hypothetical protein